MKKLAILLLISSPVYATLVSHTDYTSGATITASGQNANENAIINAVNGNIDASNIAANGVTTPAIANNAVTYSKLDAVTQSSITLMGITNSTQTWSGGNTFTSSTTLVGSTTLYNTFLSSGVALNGNYGTSGQLLTSAGSNTLPTWTNSNTAGRWVLLSAQTASNSSAITFSGLAGANYSAYEVYIDNLAPTVDAVSLRMQLSTGSGFIATGYSYENIVWAGTTSSVTSATGQPNFDVMDGAGTGAGVLQSVHVTIFGPEAVNARKRATWSSTGFYQSGLFFTTMGGGEINTQSAVIDGVQFGMSTGNINIGTFRIYGLLNN